MKKYFSLFALPLFLIVFSTVISTQIKHVQADVPTQSSCPEGSVRLSYADGSVADAYIGQVSVNADVPAPGVDPELLLDVEKWEKKNGFKKNCANCQIPFLPITKALANNNIYTAAGLTEIVKMEGGGGPYCYNEANMSVYEALSNQKCSSRYPGTVFAGFRVVLVQANYMCGVPSPWTDG